MRVALLAVTSIVVLTLGASESGAADGKASSTPPNVVAGAVKVAPAGSATKQVAGPAKTPEGASRGLERASGPRRDDRVLSLLWLLTGSSRKR